MKALSIRQPWAWAILHAGKRIENRDWAGCAFRGPLLLHASKGTGTLRDFDDDCEVLCSHVSRSRVLAEVADRTKARGRSGEIWRPRVELPLGGIVGVCDLVDVIMPGGVYGSRAYPSDPAQSAESPWYMGGLGLVLANVRPLLFTPYKGELGFFDVPEDIAGPLLKVTP